MMELQCQNPFLNSIQVIGKHWEQTKRYREESEEKRVDLSPPTDYSNDRGKAIPFKPINDLIISNAESIFSDLKNTQAKLTATNVRKLAINFFSKVLLVCAVF